MKGSGTLVASIVAASTVAFTSSGNKDDFSHPCSIKDSSSGKNGGPNSSSSDKEKFAPRFDGLRFIETLVTAHR